MRQWLAQQSQHLHELQLGSEVLAHWQKWHQAWLQRAHEWTRWLGHWDIEKGEMGTVQRTGVAPSRKWVCSSLVQSVHVPCTGRGAGPQGQGHLALAAQRLLSTSSFSCSPLTGLSASRLLSFSRRTR